MSKSSEADDARVIEAARKAAYFVVTVWKDGQWQRYPAKSLMHARARGRAAGTAGR